MSNDVLGYSSHDWRKHTDDAIVVASNIGIQLEVNKSKVIFTNPKSLKKEEVEYIGESAETIFYDIPKTIRSKVLGGKFRGQEQKWFLLRLKKDDQKIKLDNEEFPEFDRYEWVSYWQPINRIVDFKREAYRKALSELRFLV